MKINKYRSKRKITYLLMVIAFAGIIFAAYLFYTRPSGDNKATDSTNYQTPSQNQVSAGEQAKLNTVENDQKTKSGKDGSNSPADTSFTTQITAHTINSGILQIRNVIDGVYQQGTCDLTLSKDGKTIKKSAGIQPLSQSSTCQGFDIPVSQLDPGTWEIHLHVTINKQVAQAMDSVKVP